MSGRSAESIFHKQTIKEKLNDPARVDIEEFLRKAQGRVSPQFRLLRRVMWVIRADIFVDTCYSNS